MSETMLTDQERAAFHPEVTRDRALDYFFIFDNVPLQFVYRDKLIPGELSQLEKRNKAITETIWLEAYHQYLVANVVYAYFYRGPILQMPFLTHQFGASTFVAPKQESRKFFLTIEAVRTSFDAWMNSTGWKMADELRKNPPVASWLSLLNVPDRSVRIASIMPVGNQVVLELISTWTQDGVLEEAAWAATLIYDKDGTVLQDRSYIDMSHWPSGRRYGQQRQSAPQAKQPYRGAGVMGQFYHYYKSYQINGTPTELEKRNITFVEGAWLKACNAGLNADVFQPERFRMQLPVQKCSCNMDIAKEIEAITKQAAPDRKMRLAFTYAKGNQVAAEGVMTWTENGVAKESPFISFLLVDQNGKVIRERRYFTLSNWAGADRIAARLGLK